MGESFDHRPPGGIRQSRKRCAQAIHNRMVVDCLSMSSVNFAMPDFSALVPNVPRRGTFRAPLFHKLPQISSLDAVGISL
jgi:hypothetical protein